MPLASQIFYFKLDGFVSIADMFSLTAEQTEAVLPSPKEGWLKEAVSVELGMADVMRSSGVCLKEMPYEAFVCSTQDLSASAKSLSVTELEDYAIRLQHIVDGYNEGPNEDIQQALSRMIAAKKRTSKRGALKKTLSKHNKTITQIMLVSKAPVATATKTSHSNAIFIE